MPLLVVAETLLLARRLVLRLVLRRPVSGGRSAALAGPVTNLPAAEASAVGNAPLTLLEGELLQLAWGSQLWRSTWLATCLVAALVLGQTSLERICEGCCRGCPHGSQFHGRGD